MSDSLPPIDTKQEEQYQAKSFEQKVEFKKCSHKQIKYDREKGELRCPCGVAFTGPRLSELEKAIKDSL